MNKRYNPNSNNVLYDRKDGFEFGEGILGIFGSQLNGDNDGCCFVGKERHYDIEGDF